MQTWPGPRRIVVRAPEDPVEAVTEADACDAPLDVDTALIRGPLFGVAAQELDGEDSRWRVVSALKEGCPQQARDALMDMLWLRAYEESATREERRALLPWIARLERERLDELTVLGTRFRVVRADEYAAVGPDGIETPRPTDPEPAVQAGEEPPGEGRLDEDVILDPDTPLTPSQAAERLLMTGLVQTAATFPDDFRQDARRAISTHPDVLILPVTFRLVQRRGFTWQLGGSLHAAPYWARKSLVFSLSWFEPREKGLIAWDFGNRQDDARSCMAAATPEVAAALEAYADAADRVQAERLNEVEVLGTLHRVARARRLVRWGADGPEGPRPSDVNVQEPCQIRPRLDEDGVIHHEWEDGDEDADEAADGGAGAEGDVGADAGGSEAGRV
ncbi:DUF5954 family protein [Streptomyces sp. YIM 103828]|uniref:DUF5954 family protein n=1 Tax=Streptomyces sp. YIM 103828 TaxID=3158968 RepID=UPI0032D95375